MANTMTADEHARVAAAIRRAEATTAGEIYCVVARTSDGYFFTAAFMAVAGMLATALAATWLAHLYWIDLAPTTVILSEIVAFGAIALVLWAMPGLRIHFVPHRLRYRRAHDNALKQFLARNVHVTEARTGVLIFVSLAERYAEIVADAGINAKVPQATWNGIVAQLVQNARSGQLAHGFVGAVDAVGKLLAEHFPVAEIDLNELDDHVVEI